MPYQIIMQESKVQSIMIRDKRRARQIKKRFEKVMSDKGHIYYISPDGSTRELIE